MVDNVISGYAVRFGDITTIGDEWRECIAPGAFKRTLREMPDVVMILDHDSGRVLGRVSSGTLQLREDSIGLHFILNADPTTPEGQTAIGTVARQDIKGCSFGFSVRSEAWLDGEGDHLPLRTIEDVVLYEITLTAFPAYETTSAVLSQRAEPPLRRHGIEIAPASCGKAGVHAEADLAARKAVGIRKAEMEMKLRGMR